MLVRVNRFNGSLHWVSFLLSVQAKYNNAHAVSLLGLLYSVAGEYVAR